MKAAFIFLSVGCSAASAHTEVRYGDSVVQGYGVGTVEEACELAQRLRSEGYDWLELCGGFHPEGCARVAASIDDGIPVGYIDYLPENEHQRALLPRDESRHMDWAYIFVDPAFDSERPAETLTYRKGSRDLHFFGTRTADEGIALAAALVRESGFPLIELSGDFGPQYCKELVELAGDRALIGYTTWLSGKKKRN